MAGERRGAAQLEGELSLRSFDSKEVISYDGARGAWVLKARWASRNAAVALKVYERSLQSVERQVCRQREAELLRTLRHPNIVLGLGAFEDEQVSILVTEFCPGGDVHQLQERTRAMALAEHRRNPHLPPPNLGELPEEWTVAAILDPVLRALQYIHSLGLIHRDVKPENVFLTGDGRSSKLGDLGLMVTSHGETDDLHKRVGTLEFMAPEILLQEPPYTAPYSEKVDIWAVGALAAELLSGASPFRGLHDDDTAARILWRSPRGMSAQHQIPSRPPRSDIGPPPLAGRA